jgi:hypothetical protein
MPTLGEGQCLLIHCEAATGCPVDQTGRRLLRDATARGEHYYIFPSFEAAKAYASSKVAQIPTIECWVYDAAGQLLLELRT